LLEEETLLGLCGWAGEVDSGVVEEVLVWICGSSGVVVPRLMKAR